MVMVPDKKIIAKHKHRCTRCMERIDSGDTYVIRYNSHILCLLCAENDERAKSKRRQLAKMREEREFWRGADKDVSERFQATQ